MTPRRVRVWEPGMVVEGMRAWLIAQAAPDPEEGASPHEQACLRCLQHLSELTGTLMEGYGFGGALDDLIERLNR